MAEGAFAATGQVCFGLKRIYVPNHLHDRFVEAFAAAVDAIAVGPGDDPRTTMGPLNNSAQLRSVEKVLEEAVAGHATVTTLGRKLDTAAWDHGHYMMPSVVTNADPSLSIVAKEQFGPTVPIIRYTDVDEVINIAANSSAFGLAASIWTQNEERAFELGRRLDSGSVFVNSHSFRSLDPRAPFGGVKSSGMGREFSPASIDAYTELQTISRRIGPPGPPIS